MKCNGPVPAPTISQSGNGEINGLGFLFSSCVSDTGIYITNLDRDTETIILEWDDVSSIERFPDIQAEGEFYARIETSVDGIASIGIPWVPEFEALVPDSVGFRSR